MSCWTALWGSLERYNYNRYTWQRSPSSGLTHCTTVLFFKFSWWQPPRLILSPVFSVFDALYTFARDIGIRHCLKLLWYLQLAMLGSSTQDKIDSVMKKQHVVELHVSSEADLLLWRRQPHLVFGQFKHPPNAVHDIGCPGYDEETLIKTGFMESARPCTFCLAYIVLQPTNKLR